MDNPPAAAPLGHNCGSLQSHCGYWWLQETCHQSHNKAMIYNVVAWTKCNTSKHDNIALNSSKIPMCHKLFESISRVLKRGNHQGNVEVWQWWRNRICGWIRWNRRDWWHMTKKKGFVKNNKAIFLAFRGKKIGRAAWNQAHYFRHY